MPDEEDEIGEKGSKELEEKDSDGEIIEEPPVEKDPELKKDEWVCFKFYYTKF